MKFLSKKQPSADAVTAAHNKRALRNGSYATALAVAALAAAILINLLVKAIPTEYTQFDLSQNGLYTLGTTSTELVQGLNQDVTLYYLAQGGSEDTNLTKLLDRYAAASEHLSWEARDPAVYPTFASQYGAENASAGSIIAVCGQRSRVVDASELYISDYSGYYTTGSVETSFDGEHQISAAILYVTSSDTPVIYTVSGHGETELDTTAKSTVANQNLELQSIATVSLDAIPADAAAVLINAPTVDYTEADVKVLRTYLENGGALLAVTDPGAATPNLDALLAEYGLTRQEGVIVEGDPNYCMRGYSYYLLPQVAVTDLTANMTGRYFLAPIAQGIATADVEGVTATTLLTTSASAYSKRAGYNMTTTEREAGDADGPFDIAVMAENGTTGTRLVWVNTPGALDSTIDSYVSGGNSTFMLGILNWMSGNKDGLVIDAKSMSSASLVVPGGSVMLWGLTFVVLLPLVLLIIGIAVVLVRRRK